MSISEKILVVDDDPVNVSILQESLGSKYDLKTAMSGEEALEVASKFKPNIILLDIMMPGIDGYETCRRIKSDPQLCFTKILMVSAKAMIHEKLDGYNCGADDYITKPFDDDELSSKIKVFQRLKFIEELDRLKSSLLSLISHEIRTPLNSIIGFTTLLNRNPSLKGKEKEYLQKVIEGGDKILEFSEKALLLCDLKEGMELKLKSTFMAMFIKKTIMKLQNNASQASVRIVLDNRLNEDVYVDQFLMDIALIFVLKNAIKFSPSGGTITVSIKLCESGFTISIEDQGEGVDESNIQNIFSEFSIGDVSHHNEGQGLSLAIAQNISKLHGGELFVRNSAQGGAVFSFQLPLIKKKENDH